VRGEPDRALNRRVVKRAAEREQRDQREVLAGRALRLTELAQAPQQHEQERGREAGDDRPEQAIPHREIEQRHQRRDHQRRERRERDVPVPLIEGPDVVARRLAREQRELPVQQALREEDVVRVVREPDHALAQRGHVHAGAKQEDRNWKRRSAAR
jgi:hypothetical protein